MGKNEDHREKLAASGRLLEAGWHAIYHDRFSKLPQEDLREAFFCGAGYLVEVLMTMFRENEGKKAGKKAIDCMAVILNELSEFHAEIDDRETLQ
jgi:hypothetical protein